MIKFTPGPWVIDEQYVRADRKVTMICQWGSYTGIANARLIAAAPELYEALRDIAELRLANHMGPNDMALRAVDRARAILAKVDA